MEAVNTQMERRISNSHRSPSVTYQDEAAIQIDDIEVRVR